MAARLIINGHQVLGTGAYAVIPSRRARGDTARRTPPVVRVDPVDVLGERLEGAPAYRPGLPEAGGAWVDADGTVYRVVSRLDPAGGWVAAETVMRWYGVDHAAVALWTQRGLLDGAVEAGSPTKRYRVLDPQKVLDAAAAWKAARAAKPRRKR